MTVSGPGAFEVEIDQDGTLFIRGELDIATVQELEEKIDEVLVQGTPVVMDLDQLTFLDSSAIHCLLKTWKASGHPVMLRNASRSVRRILALSDGDGDGDGGSHAWAFPDDDPVVPTG